MSRGPALLVVLEGLDGVGKSTLSPLLAQALDAELLQTPPEVFRPVRSEIEAAVAHHPLARTLFYAATVAMASDRARQVLESGRSVVLDRYWLSTVAYARLRGVKNRFASITADFLRPHATIYLHARTAVRRQRLAGRASGTAEDQRTLDRATERALDRSYRQLGRNPLAGRFLVLDVSDLNPTQATQAIVHQLQTGGQP